MKKATSHPEDVMTDGGLLPLGGEEETGWKDLALFQKLLLS